MTQQTRPTYDRQTLGTPNPIARFAHRQRYRLSVDLTDRIAPEKAAVADFGAGTGHFLTLLHARRPDLRLCGVEQYMSETYDCARKVTDFTALAAETVDVITAFEVCEHLRDDEVMRFLDEAGRVLAPEGTVTVIVSVPIMYGLMLPLKELNRALLFRRGSEYAVGELLAGTLGRPVARPADPRPTHKGFDFRVLRDVLRTRFRIERELFSPFPHLPWWLNSQVFFVCSPK